MTRINKLVSVIYLSIKESDANICILLMTLVLVHMLQIFGLIADSIAATNELLTP